MHMILILIASLKITQAIVWSTDCVTGSLNTQALCEAQGYCYWSGACYFAECHKVTDIRGCRSSTTGKLQSMSKCTEITSIDPNFQNQCMEFDQTTLMWAYVRFPTDITQASSTISSGGYTASKIMTAKYTAQYKYEVLTLNILSAATADLLNIMIAYVQMQYDLVDPEIHPSYLEKAIYESMQAIRDDVTLKLSDNTRQNYYTWLWRMTDAYFLKMRSYQPYYISNKYLINFGFTNFNRYSITVQTQLQTTLVSWSSYPDNGYLELLVIPAEQFGFWKVDSDVIIIRPSKLNGDDFSSGLTYTITWSWTYTGTQPIQGTSKFYDVDKVQQTLSGSGYGSCTTSSKSCTATFSSVTATKALLITSSTSTAVSCATRYYTRCRLGRCTWTANTSPPTCA